ncbi:glycogen/starch/alpha-glucan phosphorylase [soil metagenome]
MNPPAEASDGERRAISERAALDKRALRRSFLDNLLYVQGKFPRLATQNDYYLALAHTVRDRLMQRWISTAAAYTQQASRTVCYLSAEFLMGPHLGNNLINLGIYDTASEMLGDLGLDLDQLLYQEEEPGLGNGGLGRLAACFIDSLATLEVPSLGYGIRYEYGIFHQSMVDGWQVEKTDTWLRWGKPWELPRPEWAIQIKFGGHTEQHTDDQHRLTVNWVPASIVMGVPYDTPILGYRVNTANTLRLWKAEAPESFDFNQFNSGNYAGAVNQKIVSENLSKVLYPNDDQEQGKELRLRQQYFFVSASLQDMLRILKIQGVPVSQFHEKFAVQLNDTHPSIGVAELMRLLVDENAIDWDTAWDITRRSFGYTNHTLLPEALERWSLPLFQRTLPRHLEIIYEINSRFLDQVRIRFLGDEARLARMSLIDEDGPRFVRMAHLACVGSHAINGVAALHTELLKQDVLKDFNEMWPEKFSNKTNGVTPRRWIVLANPRLTALVTETIGDGWIRDLDQLRGLEAHLDDAGFTERWQQVKRANKVDLATHILRRTYVSVNPDSLFDVQVKRIHEYKRQHLAALHIVALYLKLKNDPDADIVPRTFIFGGKAAPGYRMAKLMIKLITAIGDVVNTDPHVNDRLKVVFMPNFSVTNGQRIYPAADLSEQISTAGKEASGTGNMKFQMNGALTIGTMDGANIEILEEVGKENFFQFGLLTPEVYAWQARGYKPRETYEASPMLRDVIDLIASGFFARGDTSVFKPLIDVLLEHDPYFLLADFDDYVACQENVSTAYLDQKRWARMSIVNSARSGKFSSDRTIGQYCNEIWSARKVPVRLLSQEDVEADFMQ